MPWTSLLLDKQEHQRDLRGRKGRRVLIVGDLAHAHRAELANRGAALTLNEDHQQAMVTLAEQDFDVMVADLATCPSALRLVTLLKERAGEFLRAGFSGKRWRESGEFGELNRLIHRELQAVSARQPEADVAPAEQFEGLIGRSEQMLEIFARIRRMRMEEGPVLIVGEPGTGKTALAHAIHRSSMLQVAATHVIDCAKFQSAPGFRAALEVMQAVAPVTVVLEHIEALAADAQQVLAMFLADLKLTQVRTMATTTRDLHRLAESGEFSRFLASYFGRTQFAVPPLRERRSDIVPIAQQLISSPDFIAEYGVWELKPSTLETLLGYHWPGNVSELIGTVTEWASLGGQLGRKLPQEIPVDTDLEDVLFRAFHAAERGWNVPRETIEKAKMRHALTPFVVLSPDSGVEYAVIITAPDLSFVRDPRKMPMVNTVMTIDIAAYLGTAKPMA